MGRQRQQAADVTRAQERLLRYQDQLQELEAEIEQLRARIFALTDPDATGPALPVRAYVLEVGESNMAVGLDLGVRHFCIGWDRFLLNQGYTELGRGLRALMDQA